MRGLCLGWMVAIAVVSGAGCQSALTTWSPDGRTAAVTVGDESYLVDYSRATSIHLPGRIDASAWSADGKRLYYATPKDPPGLPTDTSTDAATTQPALPILEVVSVMYDGKVRELFEVPWPAAQIWASPDGQWVIVVASGSAPVVVAAAATQPARTTPAKIYAWNTRSNQLRELCDAGDAGVAFCKPANVILSHAQAAGPDIFPSGSIVDEVTLPEDAPHAAANTRQLARLAAVPMILQSTGVDVLTVVLRLPVNDSFKQDLYRISRPSGAIGVIARDVDSTFACSPDGSRLLCLTALRDLRESPTAYSLIFLDLSGIVAPRQVATIALTEVPNLSPAWRSDLEFTTLRSSDPNQPAGQKDLVLFRIDANGDVKEVGPISHFENPIGFRVGHP